MRASSRPLLCELHAHSRWSDGALAIADLVDLYGQSGFDVLCITDHVLRSDDPWRHLEGFGERSVDAASFPAYLSDIEHEADRARRRYGMLLVPGLELTYNDSDPDSAAHVLAVGVRRFVSVDDGIERAMRTAAQAGAAMIAAHPYGDGAQSNRTRLTRRFYCDPTLRRLAHRFELFNRTQLFGWVAAAGLPVVAAGDFHRPEHIAGWKTLLPGVRDERAFVEYLRSRRPVYLTRFADAAPLAAA